MAVSWTGAYASRYAEAKLINQLWQSKSVAIIRRKNGLLYAVLDKTEPGAEPLSVNWNRSQKVSGLDIQLNLMGELKTIATVADGTAETTSWAGTVIPTRVFAAVTLPLVHFADAEYFPSSERMRFVGDEVRGTGWVEEKMNYLMLSFENTFGTAINTSTANVPGRTSVCPWRHQISDGVETAGYKTYAGIDRSDSNCADFRGLCTTSVGDLTLAKIRERQNACTVNGGNPTVGLAATTLYGKIQSLVEAYTHVTYDETWSKFGGDYVKYAGTTFIHESRAETTTVALMDPSTWQLWMNTQPFTSSGIVQDPSRVATHVLPWECWIGFYCNKPNSNALLLGVTS